jgi:dihydroorotate dehydrogenase (fumarate)
MDLTTTYLGKKLKNPLVASASPLSRSLDNIRRLEDAGAAAIVLFSLFDDEILHETRELDYFLTYGAESYAEALSYFPEPESFISDRKRISSTSAAPRKPCAFPSLPA